MSGHKEQDVDIDTNSDEFKHEVEQTSTPLFLGDSSEGNKGDPQDEKDETPE